MAENITNYQQYVKVVMVKGEKGDTYDDTELRAELDTILANNAYVVAIEDGAFQLPIHTINDIQISAYSTWSSQKINEEIAAIIDDSQEAETSETTTISAHKLYSEISQINQNVDTTYNKVTALEPKVTTLESDVTNLKNKAFRYSNTNGLTVDMSKYNHLMIITTNKIAFVVLSATFPSSAGAGVTINSLVGNDITVTGYIKQGDILTIQFDDTTLASFCYMLSE